jgi:hypothetical protein
MAKSHGGKVNMRLVKKKVADSNRLKRLMDQVARKRFDHAKKQIIKEFDHHSVTKELQAGPDGQNLSDTLGGYGNLFSYIGFPAGTDPTVVVKNFLINSIKLKRSSKGSKLDVSYRVSLPTLDDFNFAKMPWESGKGWVSSIESGISGFNYYMAKAVEASRSGTAIQVDGKLRGRGSSAGIKYMSRMLSNFKQRIMQK